MVTIPRRGRPGLVTVALLVLMSGPAAAQTNTDSTASATEIRATLARWVEAANRQDWQAALDVWAPDLIGWYPGQPDVTYQREAEGAAHPRRDRPRTTYQVTVNEVIVSGPLAVVRDTWVFTAPAGPGTAPAVTTVRGFEVWRRGPERAWKIIRWISAPEPAATR